MAQYVVRLDRVSSVDDVLINAAGAAPAPLVAHHGAGTVDESRP